MKTSAVLSRLHPPLACLAASLAMPVPGIASLQPLCQYHCVTWDQQRSQRDCACAEASATTFTLSSLAPVSLLQSPPSTSAIMRCCTSVHQSDQ
mmetsp:Transcript_43968/g.115510  ORF Transcript_43968/g.115510 Transcript_43968/m.115510 type:complete len:94 (+) Transcript_43968:248-529(+)